MHTLSVFCKCRIQVPLSSLNRSPPSNYCIRYNYDPDDTLICSPRKLQLDQMNLSKKCNLWFHLHFSIYFFYAALTLKFGQRHQNWNEWVKTQQSCHQHPGFQSNCTNDAWRNLQAAEMDEMAASRPNSFHYIYYTQVFSLLVKKILNKHCCSLTIAPLISTLKTKFC